MRALSGLTPALSRRLQRQLLAHLPPAAARSLRRTLSLHTPAPHTAPAARSLSADHHALDDRQPHADAPATSTPSPEKSPESPDITSPHYSTLPRLRRRSNSREVTSPVLSTVDTETTSISREPAVAFACERASDRPLLSKYLTPERTLSLEESYGSDGGSAKSEPTPLGANSLATRRYSLRAPATDQQRRRVSRFLRSDFFDTPPDENLYERQRKERELETQKILREIREKKNKSQEAATARSPTDVVEAPLAYRDDINTPKKSLSPICFLAGKERSRSNTPFFPILDNIKETTVDTALSAAALRRNTDEKMRLKSIIDENSPKESKLVRPKSYPVKTLDSIEEPSENILHNTSLNTDVENSERSLPRESKLLRPKSYPTSSPSPEKVFINRAAKKEAVNNTTKDAVSKNETNNDVEVSFSITLPKKTKADTLAKTEPVKDTQTSEKHSESKSSINKKSSESDNLVLKKYQLIKNKENESSEMTEVKPEKVTAIPNGGPHDESTKVACNEDSKIKPQLTKKDATTSQAGETNQIEKKGTGKKKIIRKVASKYKSDIDSNQDTNDTKTNTEKKKVVKKVKEKVEKEKLGDDDGSKPTSVPKKKSMLQSIGQKLEKFASAKSSSPEKSTENNAMKKNGSKLNRMQREQSVPVNIEPITESNLIKRAVTLTDVAALEDQTTQPSKTTVSKVLGLFKKFEPKEKSKAIVEKCVSENIEDNKEDRCKTEPKPELGSENSEKDKPRRPTSLLLNGLGCKSKFDTASNDGVSVLSIDNDDILVSKRDNESKNIRNSLKLDFSRLPRVKKIVPTNPVIEPQIMNVSSFDNETEKKEYPEKYSVSLYNCTNADNVDTQSRSRSRSRSTISNSEIKSDISADVKFADKNALTSDNNTLQPKNHDITPEKEDIVDRIRRKSFYSRFNEKKQRRKSSLVGPGAIEYDPVARIHSQPTETKYEVSPTSPLTFDLSPLSPGPSVSSDLSPSTERYRSFLSEMPVSTRGNLRFENYGLNDKIDTYRSLDRNDFRKYPGSRSYLDYDPPTYGTSRYSRTKSLLENADTTGDNNVLSNPLRDTQKYNRTLSMYSPGSYATYRPKRTTRNSAIILKESEKEPSPENILDKIRQKKITISVTRKPESEKESLPRSNISSKGEGDGAECSEKVD